MFTGIIEESGVVQTFRPRGNRAALTIAAQTVLADLKIGDSIAVNGACLTAIEVSARAFPADVSPDTLRVTNLGMLQTGRRVNLERALRVSDRLHGHLVQGHVDAAAPILEIQREQDTLRLTIAAPASIRPYLVPKGSIAVDGISLTINACDDMHFTCTVIPHTLNRTTLPLRKAGDLVNLESDLIGRYVATLLRYGPEGSEKKQVIDMAFLQKYGWE